MRALTISLLLLAGAANAATYYVATTGNDTNGTGAAATPWASLIKAVTVLAPGDTVLVQPGMYSNTVVNIRSNGTASDRITIRAAGPVTNWFGIRIYSDYLTLDGFTFHSGSASVNYADGWSVHHMRFANYNTITNCTFWRRGVGYQDPATTAGQTSASGPPSFNLFTHSAIYNVTNGNMMNIYGNSNVVAHSLFSGGADIEGVFMIFGTNHVITQNKITGIDKNYVTGKHADIFQTWGANSSALWCANVVFERNLVIDCEKNIQFCQLVEEDGGLNIPELPDEFWGITVRNNLVINGPGQMSISIPNFRLINNTFSNITGAINYNFYDPEHFDWRGSAHHGLVVNNVFLNAQYVPGVAFQSIGVGLLTNSFSLQHGKAWASISSIPETLDTSDYRLTFRGYCTDLSSPITQFDLYRYSDGTMLYSRPATDLDYTAGNGLTNYWVSSWTMYVTNGQTINGQASMINDGGMGIRIKTVSNPGGELVARLSPYSDEALPVPSDLVRSNNFTGTASQLASMGPNGLTGASGMIGYRPAAGSQLIDAGADMSAYGVTDSHDGSARPLGAGVDIGAYEFDPSLLLHLDFDRGFTNTSVVEDVTGYGRHGIGFRTNNWIVPTNGIFGSTGAMFRTNGWATNGLSRYETSQYLAVTNVTGLTPLTNMTVSFWAENIGKTGSQKLVYMLDAAARNNTNSWRIGRLQLPDQNRMSMRVYKAGTTDSQGDLIGYWPANTKSASDLTTTNGLELYTVTIDCGEGKARFYLNGTPRATNTITVPSFSVSPGDPTPWICVGAHKYGTEGSYYWGDDGFPNDAYMNGSMDDVRIYNRTLTAIEVASLYAGQAGASLASTPPPIEEPEPVPPAITAQSGDVHIARGATVMLSVTAAGTAPFTYQWSKNGVAISETSATMTLQGIDSSAGYYWCVVSNAYGSVTSTPMTVTVEPAPTERQRGIRGNGRIIGNGRIL